MDERDALRMLAAELPGAGDDAAVVDDLVVTTDMLHETTDFPPGTTRSTAGWRAVGASLSDLAAMGADAVCAVAVYAAPAFEPDELRAFLDGATGVCDRVGAEYVGGDLDDHEEFTVATTAVGRTDDPVFRSGASPGEAVCVTGTLGRSAAAVRLFERGGTDRDAVDRANDLFRFEPRVAGGRALRPHATAMIDSSDGLARSLHQVTEASDCGVALDREAVPVHPAVDDVASDPADRWELACHYGEDFELVFATPDPDAAAEAAPAPVTVVGEVVEDGVTVDGDPLPDRGWTHGQE